MLTHRMLSHPFCTQHSGGKRCLSVVLVPDYSDGGVGGGLRGLEMTTVKVYSDRRVIEIQDWRLTGEEDTG